MGLLLYHPFQPDEILPLFNLIPASSLDTSFNLFLSLLQFFICKMRILHLKGLIISNDINCFLNYKELCKYKVLLLSVKKIALTSYMKPDLMRLLI